MQATLEDLALSPERGLDRRQLLELGQCTWVGNNLNILVLEPTGTGKSYLAGSLGTAPVRLGNSARYFRTSRLLHALNQTRQEASYPTLLRSLARSDPLILDDWMRDPLTSASSHTQQYSSGDISVATLSNTTTSFCSRCRPCSWHNGNPDLLAIG